MTPGTSAPSGSPEPVLPLPSPLPPLLPVASEEGQFFTDEDCEEAGVSRSASQPAMTKGGGAANLLAPQGFRRHFLNTKADQKGIPPERRPGAWQTSFMDTIRPLVLSGYYDSILGMTIDPETGMVRTLEAGSVSTAAAGITLVKSFVGTGIMFLQDGFAQGGWLFSSVTMLAIAVVQGLAIARLVSCCKRLGMHSYGEVARDAVGKRGEFAVQLSLLLNVFGVCTTYIAFIAEVATSMGLRFRYAVLLQLPLLLPMCMIRTLDNMVFPNLAANVLILFGLAVVFGYGVEDLVSQGVSEDITAFNVPTSGLFIGFAAFAFEGAPMQLPIRAAMKQTDHFVPLYFVVIAGVALFYTVFALFMYLPYGKTQSEAQTVALLSMPAGSYFTDAVQLTYTFAVMLSIPLNFLPGARILELWIFGAGDHSKRVCATNSIRIVCVLLCALLAAKGGENFDTMLAFIGAFCTLPIQLIYPALFHMKLIDNGLTSFLIDLFLVSVGVLTMFLTLLYL